MTNELTGLEKEYLIRLLVEDHKSLIELISRVDVREYPWLIEERDKQLKIMEKLEYGTN